MTLDETIVALRRALAAQPGNPETLFNLANSLQMAGKFQEAIANYRMALSLQPQFFDAWYNLGVALRRVDLNEQAIEAFRRAIALRPDSADALNNLGSALFATGKLDEGKTAIKEALRLRPGFALAHNNFGIVLHKMRLLDEAMSEYRQAIQNEPHFAEPHENLGAALIESSRLGEAIDVYQHLVDLEPRNALAHCNLGLALLLQGELQRGLEHYEWRWKAPELGLRELRFSQPYWDGSNLDGRRLLLVSEQGFGDTIQFIRYAKLIVERGGKIILACWPELARVMRSMPGIENIIVTGDRLPQFDAYCPLMSLARTFSTTLQTIPAPIPYLFADEQLSIQWRGRFPDAPIKVGLAWMGKKLQNAFYLHRDITLIDFASLAEVTGAKFYSLQVGPAAKQAHHSPPGLDLTDWTQELRDFADTAALIQNLDLVITVDTAVAHLAGAMGKPVWLLLPFIPDWRWMLDCGDSPWYPTMKLFRQPAPLDWATPIQQIKQALLMMKHS